MLTTHPVFPHQMITIVAQSYKIHSFQSFINYLTVSFVIL